MIRYFILLIGLLTMSTGICAQTISGLSYSPSDTTIVASWTTNTSANSNITCGSKAGIDNSVSPNSTSHQAIVTGLAPVTAYSCTVTSGSTTSSPQNVTTLSSVTRTLISSATVGPVTMTGNRGDGFSSFVSNDNNTYATGNDGYGFSAGGPNAGANMQVALISNEADVTGSLVNILSAYGPEGSSNGTDGPMGAPLSNKLLDIMSMAGDLYMTQGREANPSGLSQFYQLFYGNIMMSQDHGVTWNSWQAPSVFSANGIPPSPLGSYMFANGNIGDPMFVKYAADDGTMGYLTAGNRIDGADGWIYMHYGIGGNNLMNSSAEYLMRVPRAQMALQSTTAFQYWIGPTSPTPADFVNDSNWSSSATGSTSIYTATAKVSWAEMDFVPALNCYLWMQFYYTSLLNSWQTNSTTWTFLTGPTPAGPWTQFFTQVFAPQGWYHPTAMFRTVESNTVIQNIPIKIVFSGDYNNGGLYYYPSYTTLTLNPAAAMTNATLSQGALVQ